MNEWATTTSVTTWRRIVMESDVQRWERLYTHLLDIEHHWTAQTQNQQQRISTILTVNGFLLGFLAVAGFTNSIVQSGAWPASLFLIALATLAAAFGAGILSLKPTIPISGAGIGSSWKAALMSFRPARRLTPDAPALWLNPADAMRLAQEVPEEEAVRSMCESLVDGQVRANHAGVLRHRRLLMYRELVLVLIGLVLLVLALIAFQVEGS
jgi:hypothetical protein